MVFLRLFCNYFRYTFVIKCTGETDVNFTQGHLVKIKWFVTDVTAVGSPDRAERAILGVILAGRVFGQSRSFCCRRATSWQSHFLLSPNDFIQGHLMKVEWFVGDVTAVGSSDRAERAILEVILAVFFQSRSFCGRGATLSCRNPLLSSNYFTQGHLMKIELFIADVTAVGSPDREEHAIWGVILAWHFVDQFTTRLWLRGHLTMQEPPLES